MFKIGVIVDSLRLGFNKGLEEKRSKILDSIYESARTGHEVRL